VLVVLWEIRMRIKEIYIKDFGPYHEWSFTPASEGVQVIYGPNESGKTSLLEALRFLLFGKKVKFTGMARAISW